MLLSRTAFESQAMHRDSGLCVLCGERAVDVHHILDRKLFDDGGYYLNNGASLCSECHLDAELGNTTPQELRDIIGITEVVLPKGLSENVEYDKWGKVQKYFKYPRTYHMPWSDGLQNDDKRVENPNMFDGKKVVVTVKMDGENTTMYNDYFHARSLDSRHHASRNYVKGIHGSVKYNIIPGARICGENLYAEHAIKYENLRSYFQVFSVWTPLNNCLTWVETVDFCESIGLVNVPVIYEGIYDEAAIRKIGEYYFEKGINDDPIEGYVIRDAYDFHYDDFTANVAKVVRKGHVGKEDIHWMSQWNESMVNKLG